MGLMVTDCPQQGFHSGQILYARGIFHPAGGIESMGIHGSM